MHSGEGWFSAADWLRKLTAAGTVPELHWIPFSSLRRENLYTTKIIELLEIEITGKKKGPLKISSPFSIKKID